MSGTFPGTSVAARNDLDPLQSDGTESACENDCLKDLRVLLADDSIDIQEPVQLCLRRAGMRVEIVDNGQAALAKVVGSLAGGAPFDLVIMDGEMPRMNGYDAARRLREFGYTGPILALTASALPEDCERFLAAGATDYLAKPMNADALMQAIHRCLAGPPESRVFELSAGEQAQVDDESSDALESPADSSVHDGLESLLPLFYDDLEMKIDQMRQAMQTCDVQRIASIAHQIKGAAGIYGFPSISLAASSVVQAARSNDAELPFERLLHRLLELCGRATRNRRDAQSKSER